MIELYISQNKNTASEAYGKYYPRVSYKQTIGIHEMAIHMAEHNTPGIHPRYRPLSCFFQPLYNRGTERI
ncbi:MAG: hypothetical protein J6Q22_02045 [Prevotella sp.]|nr:hypothetical protein [Prevotella sp.]